MNLLFWFFSFFFKGENEFNEKKLSRGSFNSLKNLNRGSEKSQTMNFENEQSSFLTVENNKTQVTEPKINIVNSNFRRRKDILFSDKEIQEIDFEFQKSDDDEIDSSNLGNL